MSRRPWPDGGRGVGADRVSQQFVVDVPEVRRDLQVAVVEVGKARFVAVEAALDRFTRDQHTGPAVPWSVPWEALAAGVQTLSRP
jgi:hypothetical protein